MFHHVDLTGSRVIITGASRGIGAALAKELAGVRARLALAARPSEQLEAVARELRGQGAEILVVPTDITDARQRQGLITAVTTAYGGIDVLVNNAGIGATGSFAEASEARLRPIFEVNFFAAVELTRLVLPYLKGGRNPLIVNISSIIGRRAVPGYSEYCASKFALTGWSEALRAELAHEGIHVLLVCPGPTETTFSAHLLEDRLEPPKYRTMSARQCAHLVVRGMRKRRHEVVTGSGGKLLLLLNRLFPRLVDQVLAREFAHTRRPPSA